MVDELNVKLRHVTLNVGKNPLLKFAVKYVGKRMGFVSYSVHMSQESALKEIRKRKLEPHNKETKV